MRIRHSLASAIFLLALGTTALAGSGCSMLFVDAPPPKPPSGCTTSYVAPVADALLAVGYIAAGAVLLASGDHNTFLDARSLGGVSLAVGVPFAISSGYGFATVSKCHDYAATPLAVPPPK